ncbi:hypothetical protein P886_2188 [Alteromonadaceae bacterium 2753L.S.0a.02]|nr:hypothetical protein P886_2188 [Alteromonadaceae bacterium 2753L.S.0a.02]
MRGIILLICFYSSAVLSAQVVVGDTKIQYVLVNGGEDSPNSGTTCIKISDSVRDTCNGYVAVINNNQALLSAALHAKATGNSVWFYYDDNKGNNHCPGAVFTPCALNSIGLR